MMILSIAHIQLLSDENEIDDTLKAILLCPLEMSSLENTRLCSNTIGNTQIIDPLDYYHHQVRNQRTGKPHFQKLASRESPKLERKRAITYQVRSH